MNGIGKLLSRTLRVFAKNVHENAVNHGWWDEERSEERARAESDFKQFAAKKSRSRKQKHKGKKKR